LEGFVCRQLVTGLMKEPHCGGLGKMLTQQQHGAENQAATHSWLCNKNCTIIVSEKYNTFFTCFFMTKMFS